MPLSTLIADDGANARLGWGVLVAAGVLAVVGIGVDDPLWIVFAAVLVGVAVLPATVYRDWSVLPPWEVLAFALLPLLVRALDAPEQLTRPAAYLAVAVLALLAVVELHVFSSVEVTPGAAVVLVVLLTTAAVGVWTVLRFAADAFLGTNYIAGKVGLMWDVTFATAGGVVAGPLTWAYLRYHPSVGNREFDVHGSDRGGDSDRGRGVDDGDATRGTTTDDATRSDDADRTGGTDRTDDADDAGDRTLTVAVRGMQLGLAAITLFAVATFRWGLVVNAGVPLAVTFLPALLERDLGVPMNAGLAAWITLAVFLHAVGAVGPYQWFGWYDSVTHTLSATVVAGAGYASARAVDLHSNRLAVPSPFMGAFIVAFVLAFGVLWEIMEFGTGGLASVIGGEAVLAQYGARDIVLDLVFNAVGAIIVAVLGASRLRGVAANLASRIGTRTA